ncbi:major intrinsically disordered Notch2-binding receptor 1-like isoform X1 [Synchiropus splendidus]|uniref:major intrinsically disordered Notch2-binding receptor 1-like isoform X1 n=1 Tax=Synchiropus splendidus TaxID=270530 RepID=UPI00237EA1FF|nr:major intrinsically disordered Notch2-binding receptor 1-like isoform X1 [Synchiropus splendidus]
MASLQQEYPEVLLGILEELANMRQWLTFQDLCRMVSTRFDLEHLIELRSLLYAAASRDPCFPATLFRDRVSTRGQGLSPIGVAADIVTIFNLIQMTGGSTDDRGKAVQPVDQSPGPSLPGIQPPNTFSRERARAHSDSSSRLIDEHLLFPSYPSRKRASLPPDPLSLMTTPPARARAVSFDLPHTTFLYSSGQVPNEIMKNMYLPLETDSESSGDSAPIEVFEPEQESAVDQKRNIFRKDFHNQPPLLPQVTVNSESPSPNPDKKSFDNPSFETIPNPYPSPKASNQSPEQRAKHESIDDLQDSTYFGPGSVSQKSPRHLQPPRSQKPIWTNKSHSLEDQIGLGRSRLGMESKSGQLPRRSTPTISNLGGSSGGESADSGLPGGSDQVRAQGTQTDPPDTRRLRSLVHADRLSFMTSLDDPELAEDDISAIFRFLDDISMCGSTGVLHATDGTGGLNPDSHEARRGRLGQLQRLFHSLESSDDGLKASVCKLLLRMSQIERQLESLNDVKAEISQVLSALQRLDEKIQQPIVAGEQSTGGRWLEPLSGVSSFMSHPVTPSELSEPQPLSVSGNLYPGTSSSSLEWSRWNNSGEQPDNSKGPVNARVKDGTKELSCRGTKVESNGKNGPDSKQPNKSNTPRDWTVSFSKGKVGKSSIGKPGKVDQSSSTTNLLAQKPSLIDQMLNSSLFRHKDSSLSGGLTSGRILDSAEARARPIWTVDDREARISPFDLQTSESLNPNNVEFWMDDVYTPGYDALLRRKEADMRRAKVCKVAALVAIIVAVILIIVIILCTLLS